MNRILVLFFMMTIPLLSIAQSGYDEYDENNPSDPAFGGTTLVTLKPMPSISAGYFGAMPVKIEKGNTYTFSAYPYPGYVFECWMKGEERLSNQPALEYLVEDDKPVTLLAVFKYAPEGPGNPRPNNWDAENGELIVDDFKPGSLITSLNAAIQSFGINISDIRQVTIAGRIDAYDFQALSGKGFTSCQLLDFSRTTGLNVIPCEAYVCDNNLRSIFLPESVTEIGKNAFFQCSNLDLVYCYALIPPVISNDSCFSSIGTDAALYVPLTSQQDYLESDWAKCFTINAIPDEHIGSIQLNLPEESHTLYRNMSIELVNQVSGQVHKYIVTDRWQYTFNNLLRKTQWKAYLKNQVGLVLSEIGDITVNPVEYSAQQGWQVQVYDFTDIKPLYNVSAQIYAGAENVADGVSLNWSYGENKTFLSREATATGLLEGMNLTLSLVLPENLAMLYANMDEQQYVVTDEKTQVLRVDLVAHPVVNLNGTIFSDEGEPIAGAVVAVSQTLNGKYTKSLTAMTNSQGSFAIEVMNVPSTLTWSAPNYVENTTQLASIDEEPLDLRLTPIQGARIGLKLNFTQVDGSVVDFPNPERVNYTVKLGSRNLQFRLQQKEDQSYEIILLEKVKTGDQLTLTATSQEDRFKSTNATVIIADNSGNAVFAIKQYGSILATYRTTENNAVIGMLFKSSKLFRTGDFDTETCQLLFEEVPDANYSLVVMKKSDFFGTVQNMNSLKNLGLVDKKDYVSLTKVVSSGKVVSFAFATVPLLDEAKLQYTDKNTTLFSINLNEISAGNYLTVSSKVSFKQANKRYISNARLVIDFPESIDENEGYFVNNSLLIGGKLNYSDYQISGNQIIINIDEHLGKDIKFCVIPSRSGENTMSAYVMFDYDGLEMTQPIGHVSYTVKEMSINVPSVSATKEIVVSGTAVGRSSIDIFCDGMLIAQTTSLANGVWATLCTLPVTDDYQDNVKNIYAVITTSQGVHIVTPTLQCRYSIKAIDVRVVHMYHYNPECHTTYDVVYNFKSPSLYAQKYIYYIFNRAFSFTLDFSENNPENLRNVYIGVKTGNVYTDIPARYSNGSWVASGNFGDYYNSSKVPVNVRVSYDQMVDGVFHRHYVVYSGCLDARVAIDPSGYVYEGVSSNRIEGATATIYYKEDEVDMYGAITTKEYLWNAEEFAQKNPLFTDADGMYRWDVPQGLWQVRIEKEGYESAKSEWLPVPPPQLDINIPIVQNSVPEVVSANAFETSDNNDFVDVTFNKYMKVESFNADAVVIKTISDQQETKLENLQFEFLDKEASAANNQDTLARKVRIYCNAELGLYDEVHLYLSSSLKSYAGMALQAYNQELDVNKKIQKLVCSEEINLNVDGDEKTVLLTALPADASKGKSIKVTSSSGLFVVVSADGTEYADAVNLTLDSNGEANVHVKGLMEGTASLAINVEESDVQAQVTTKVLDASYFEKVEEPAFTTQNTDLYSGQTVGLKCNSHNASIYFTLDGSEPSPQTSQLYEKENPIVITGTTVIKAMAVGLEPSNMSDVITGTYHIKKGTCSLFLSKGWNWSSHNIVDAGSVFESLMNEPSMQRIVAHDGEYIFDTSYGWVGSIANNTAGYGFKLQVKEPASLTVLGDESNPNTTIISLNKGWNWIGYPISQTQSITEALEYAMKDEIVEDGDQILSLTAGYAQYENSIWHGDLKNLSPSSAYMYYSVSDKTFTFTDSKVSKSKSHSKGALQESILPWTVNVHSHPNVMGVTMEVSGYDFSDTEVYVGAFCGNECRGMSKISDGLFYLSIHGQQGDLIAFRMVEPNSNYELTAEKSIEFVSDIIGTPSHPYVMTFGEPTCVQSFGEVTTELDNAAVYDVSGRLVSTMSKQNSLRSGLYIVSSRKCIVK